MNQRHDLLLLHMMAITNTPTDPDEAAVSMREYREHRERCIERYGRDATWHAEYYGLPAEKDALSR